MTRGSISNYGTTLSKRIHHCVVCKLVLSKFNIPYVRFINNKGKQVTIKTEDLK